MQMTIRGKNLEVTDALKDYVEKKLSRLQKYFYRPVSAQVTLGVERGWHLIEVTLPIDGLLLRGEGASEDMYASVDQVMDKLERQIHKYKTRINRKLRRDGNHVQRGIVVEDGNEPAGEEDPAKVVRVKRFFVKPMEVEEAVLQMNLLGHDFFVFLNADTEDVSVVYRRKEGGYGLIEPSR